MHNCGIERSRGSVTPIFSPILIGTRERGELGVFARPAFALHVNLLFRTPSLLRPYLLHPRVPVGFLTFPLFVVRSILALCRASQHGRAIPVRRFFHAIPVDSVQSDRIDSTDPWLPLVPRETSRLVWWRWVTDITDCNQKKHSSGNYKGDNCTFICRINYTHSWINYFIVAAFIRHYLREKVIVMSTIKVIPTEILYVELMYILELLNNYYCNLYNYVH